MSGVLLDQLTDPEVGEARRKLDHARHLILEAETSCFLFWGDSWVPKVYERTGPARQLLREAEAAAKGAAR
jgi:hypothetical protein